MVSVCVQTYQQAEYISRCLDSILGQETEFPFEIVLGEDESTDGTREICIAYQKKYPDRIRLFLRRRQDVIFIDGRPSGRHNMLENLRMARGRYVALCEGDDFWIDKRKLSKQYEYLESHPTCSAVFTDMVRVDSQGNLIRKDTRVPSGVKCVETYMLMQMNSIHTSNFFFRREVLNSRMIAFIRRMPYGDMSLFLICSLWGPIGYISEFTSAYTVNVGVLRHLDKADRGRNGLKIRKELIKEFPENTKLRKQYNIAKKGYYLRISEGAMRKGDFFGGLKAYFRFLCSSIYRIFPAYPVVAPVRLRDYFAPVRAVFGYARKRVAKLGVGH